MIKIFALATPLLRKHPTWVWAYSIFEFVWLRGYISYFLWLLFDLSMTSYAMSSTSWWCEIPQQITLQDGFANEFCSTNEKKTLLKLKWHQKPSLSVVLYELLKQHHPPMTSINIIYRSTGKKTPVWHVHCWEVQPTQPRHVFQNQAHGLQVPNLQKRATKKSKSKS